MANDQVWWDAPKKAVHNVVLRYVQQIEQEQGDIFDRFVKLEQLYDPNTPDGDGEVGHVQENVIATGVDTLTAVITSTDIRARVMTDGADWGQRRRARHLEFYAEELKVELGIMSKCRRSAKESYKKGMGLTKWSTVFDEPRVEHVAVENVVVDQNECRDGKEPMQFHQWDTVDADELMARFPKSKEAIKRARGRRTDWGRNYWQRPAHHVAVLYSWRMAIGKKGTKWYVPGRETIVIDGHDLLDQDYEEQAPPFACLVNSVRQKSWYGISSAERVMGIQKALNRRNKQIERILDQNAVLTTYIRPADANLTVKTHRIGALAVVKGDYPQTPNPPIVSGETYQDKATLRTSGLEEMAIPQTTARATKPAGLDSAVALREHKDQTTERHAEKELGFEQLVLDTIKGALSMCKKLGKKAPTMIRRGRFGARQIPWNKVDMREVGIQLAAASNLNRTPAGRVQAVIEYAQAGIISQDEARELLQHPDLEAALSRYTAALEAVEYDLDEIADGNIVTPDPMMNLDMCHWRGQMDYQRWTREGAPEEIVETLRNYIVTAVWMAGQAANTNAPAVGADMGAAPIAADPMAPMPGMPPAGPAPTPALASQAMMLRAS